MKICALMGIYFGIDKQGKVYKLTRSGNKFKVGKQVSGEILFMGKVTEVSEGLSIEENVLQIKRY